MSAVTEARTRDPGCTIGVARVKCACTMFGCVCAEPCRTRTKVNISAEFAARTVRSTKGTDLICVLKNMIRKHVFQNANQVCAFGTPNRPCRKFGEPKAQT